MIIFFSAALFTIFIFTLIYSIFYRIFPVYCKKRNVKNRKNKDSSTNKMKTKWTKKNPPSRAKPAKGNPPQNPRPNHYASTLLTTISVPKPGNPV